MTPLYEYIELILVDTWRYLACLLMLCAAGFTWGVCVGLLWGSTI